jgi:hypothetical protein
LLGAGFHPSLDYALNGNGGGALANYPILVPLAELKEAQAFVRGMRAGVVPVGQAPKPLSDRPVGPLPPEDMKGNLAKALGVIAALVALGAVITVAALVLQWVMSLASHGR